MSDTQINLNVLINEFVVNLQAQAAQEKPRQIEAPDRPGPYHVTPQRLLDRQQIEAQLRALVEASTAHLYELLQERFNEVQAAQNELIETERKRIAEQRDWQARQERKAAGMCAPSRDNFYG